MYIQMLDSSTNEILCKRDVGNLHDLKKYLDIIKASNINIEDCTYKFSSTDIDMIGSNPNTTADILKIYLESIDI